MLQRLQEHSALFLGSCLFVLYFIICRSSYHLILITSSFRCRQSNRQLVILVSETEFCHFWTVIFKAWRRVCMMRRGAERNWRSGSLLRLLTSYFCLRNFPSEWTLIRCLRSTGSNFARSRSSDHFCSLQCSIVWVGIPLFWKILMVNEIGLSYGGYEGENYSNPCPILN